MFPFVAFINSKLKDSLDPHLLVMVGMYSQNMFSPKSSPNDAIFNSWTAIADANVGYGLIAWRS